LGCDIFIRILFVFQHWAPGSLSSPWSTLNLRTWSTFFR
jgi:hypothetical protein